MGNQQSKQKPQQKSNEDIPDEQPTYKTNQHQKQNTNVTQNNQTSDIRNQKINNNKDKQNSSRAPSKLNKHNEQNKTNESAQKNQNTTKMENNLQNQRKGNYYLEHNDDDDNQFMPLMKLQPTGQINLRITLIQLTRHSVPKLHLKKTNSVYNSVMKWTKNSRNIFTFNLKQDSNYQLVMQVDIQGNTLNNTDQFWSVLCPINIPFGQSVKVGQMTCVNWYCRLDQQGQQQQQDQQTLGPSLKNIDFKVSQQTFGKWNEKIPKNFYDEKKNQVVKKVYQKQSKTQPKKFIAYKELSRYFDQKNNWRATTYIQQTSDIFKGWIIEVRDHHSSVASISNELHSDFKNRQQYYTKFMYQDSKKDKSYQFL